MKIRVKVKPGKSKEEISRNAEGDYTVYLKECAEGGKANAELRNMLARKFGVSAKQIIIKNLKGRKKIVEIEE